MFFALAAAITFATAWLILWPLVTHGALPNRNKRRVLSIALCILLLAWPLYLALGIPQLAVLPY